MGKVPKVSVRLPNLSLTLQIVQNSAKNMCNGNTAPLAREDAVVVQVHDGVLLLRMFWVKKMGKVGKVTLYALSFKPNPPNSAK